MLTVLVLASATPGKASNAPTAIAPAVRRPVMCAPSSFRPSCAQALSDPIPARIGDASAANPLVSQPRMRIQSASARASMRPSAARIAVALRCLRPSAARLQPTTVSASPAGTGSSSSARILASRLGARRPTAAACSSGSPAPPRRSRARRAPSRCGTPAGGSTAPVSRGSVASGPKATPRPSARAGEQTQQAPNVSGQPPGRRAAASRASSTRRPVGRLEVQRQRRGRPRRSASRRRAASRGRRRGARARAACRAARAGAGSPWRGRRRAGPRRRTRSRRWRSRAGR